VDTDRKILFFGGKGGVGKTTVASATALHLSRQYRTILISTDPAHSISSSLDRIIGNEITCIREATASTEGSLFALEIDAEKAYRHFRDRYEPELKMIMDTSTHFDDEDIDLFMKIPMPGIDEVMGFNVIADLVSEASYERYVIDTAPTGHVLRLLALPDIFDEWIKALAQLRWKYRYMVTRFAGEYKEDNADDFLLSMKKSVNRIRRMLNDQQQTAFVAVACPEGMVVEETGMLLRHLCDLHIHVGDIVLNNVATSEGCQFCRNRKAMHEHYIHLMEEVFDGYRFSFVPLQDKEIKGMEALDSINSYLFP